MEDQFEETITADDFFIKIYVTVAAFKWVLHILQLPKCERRRIFRNARFFGQNIDEILWVTTPFNLLQFVLKMQTVNA